jgi:hypothetical protein
MSKKTDKNREFLFCHICNYTASRTNDFNKHINTQKHIKKSIASENEEINQKNADEKPISNFIDYECLYCNFNSNDKKDYRRHLLTQKHKKNEEKNKLNDSKLSNVNDETNYKELLMTTLKQNKEMQEFIFKQHETIEKQQKTINEIIPKIGNNTINSNNKFNLNIFLNETCKDAISMEEFINKIQVSLSDLFYTKNKGIAEGVSNIFIENLNKIPLTQRPIHCTDVKRETIYIKNEQWEKDEKKEKTKDAIKKVSNLQTKNINKYKESNPDYMNSDKKKEDFINIIKVATSDIEGKEEKIIKNICKEVYVNEEIIKSDLLVEN